MIENCSSFTYEKLPFNFLLITANILNKYVNDYILIINSFKESFQDR